MATLELTPAQVVERLEHGFGLTAEDLARVLDVGVATVEDWRAGDHAPSPDVWSRLITWLQLFDRITETFADGPKGAQEWLHTPHRYLGWQTPAEVAKIGRFDRVDAALGALEWGIFI